jgi:adenosylmethionine---8-amino-7-oxononanoate aminotransferase
LEHVLFAGCTHRPAVELAETLVPVLPPGLTRIFYSDNGSTAVEVALKMAYQYWQNLGQRHRTTFITLHHAYHGDTVGAMSVSEDSAFTLRFKPLLFEVQVLPPRTAIAVRLAASGRPVALIVLATWKEP